MNEPRRLVDRVRERFPEVSERQTTGMETVVVPRERLVELLAHLRDGEGFDLLSDLSAVDWLPREPRFEVNYHLTRTADATRLRVKVALPDGDETMPTVTEVYPTANWHEREVYDFFGIDFTGHPELRRIFMPDEWIGHPLRKDYSIGGVPVEYKIEPAYVGDRVVSEQARPAAGGVPGRLARDRGRPSRWTWTGPPATGVRIPRKHPPEDRPTTEPPSTPGEPYTEGGGEE